MIRNAYLSRRACLAASAACLALLLGGCGGSDDSDDAPAPTDVPIVTPPSSPVVDPGDACTCAAPDTQRSCAP